MEPVVRFENIAAQAISTGASSVGAVHVSTLLDSPSHRLLPVQRRVRAACSIVVLALAHDGGRPEMDWWDTRKGGTPGNRRLINITSRLIKWFRKEHSIEACRLPYHAGQGGIFLKDAAILAGLGVIGKNNLLITPQFGPRVRLGALMFNLPVQYPPGPLDGFAPCDGCDGPCMRACPKQAFPGGSYQRKRCLLQMKKDETRQIELRQPIIGMPAEHRIAYCRLCELSCPVGR